MGDGKRGPRFIRILLVVAGLVSLGVVLVQREILPRLLTSLVSTTLEEEGVEVEAFRVKSLGLGNAEVSPVRLSFDNQDFGWDSLVVGYDAASLLTGKIEGLSLAIDQPYLVLRWPMDALFGESPGGGEEDLPAPDPAAPVPGPGAGAQDGAGEATLPPAEQPAGPLTAQAAADEIFRRLEGMPFSQLSLADGLFDLWVRDRQEVAGQWDMRFLNGPDPFAGNILFEDHGLSLTASLNAARAARTLAFHGRATASGERLERLLALLREDGLPLPPGLAVAGSLQAEALFEAMADGEPGLSVEALLESVRAPLMEGMWLEGRDLRAMGTWQEAWRGQAGGMVTLGGEGPLRVSPFHFRAGLETDERVELETESFTAEYGDWSGRFALFGSGQAGWRSGDPRGRLELAFSSLVGPFLEVEPASLLLEGPEPFTLTASALGLKRQGTLWVEELKVTYEQASGLLQGGFSWYNALGMPMGSLSFESPDPLADPVQARLALSDAGGVPFLRGEAAYGPAHLAAALEGSLPVGWLNALNQWGWDLPLSFSGKDPRLDLTLSGQPAFPIGEGQLLLDGLAISVKDGPELSGITGSASFAVKGLPRTMGLQTLKVASITTGELELEELVLDWAMPTFRTLEVRSLSARVDSGRLEIEPFTVDLLEPALRTRIRLSGLPVGQLLELLGEERFRVEGGLSGSIDLEYREGALYLGRSEFGLDKTDTENRFLFVDRTFLEDQFASFQGIPGEVKGSLLDALLEEGIRIDDLMLQFGSMPDRQTVSLKLTVSGETATDRIVVPIKGLVINNLISEADLAHVLGLVGAVHFLREP